MKRFSMLILLLIFVLIQGSRIQDRDKIISLLAGTWTFQEGKIIKSDLKLDTNTWGIDTMTFETDKTFKWNTPYSDSVNGEMRYRKNYGIWDISVDGKYLILSEIKAYPPYMQEDIELDSIGNKLELKIIKNTKLILFHSVRISNSSEIPDNIRPRSGITKAKITYLKVD